MRHLHVNSGVTLFTRSFLLLLTAAVHVARFAIFSLKLCHIFGDFLDNV